MLACSAFLRMQFYWLYMNLNATKRPFGHFDVNVLKMGNSEKILLYAFLKLHCIWMLKTLDHQEINEFKSIYLFQIWSYLPFHLFYAFFL